MILRQFVECATFAERHDNSWCESMMHWLIFFRAACVSVLSLFLYANTPFSPLP